MYVKAHMMTKFQNLRRRFGAIAVRIGNKWEARQRAALKPFDLTHVQFIFLTVCLPGYAYQCLHQKHFTEKQLVQNVQKDIMMTSRAIRKSK